MSIANNRKAFHDYFIEEQIQAGLVLEGWEVKAIRAGRVQLKESYIYWKKMRFIWSAATSPPCQPRPPTLSQTLFVRENCYSINEKSTS